MTRPPSGDILVCACGDPTCVRGALPWLPCQNPDRLIDNMLALARRHKPEPWPLYRARALARIDTNTRESASRG